MFLWLINYLDSKPFTRDSTNSTMNMKNNILAIPADAPAIPPNPKIPAIMAIITNVIVQRNIILVFKINILFIMVFVLFIWCSSYFMEV